MYEELNELDIFAIMLGRSIEEESRKEQYNV